IQNYIKRNYMKNTQQWALWARQHSPLLLQVTTTNPLESYHSELKRLTSSLHGLIGMYVLFIFRLFHLFFIYLLFLFLFSFLFLSLFSFFVSFGLIFSFSFCS